VLATNDFLAYLRRTVWPLLIENDISVGIRHLVVYVILHGQLHNLPPEHAVVFGPVPNKTTERIHETDSRPPRKSTYSGLVRRGKQ
jgi:hypothetical protein